MNLNDLKSHLTDDSLTEPRIDGQWFPIRLMPDPVTGEVFNIGVALIDSRGRIHNRLLDSLDGLHCIYQDRLNENDLRFLFKTLNESLTHPLDSLRPPSPNIIFGQQQPASGDSIEGVIDSLYRQMVTLGQRQTDTEEKPRSQSLINHKARSMVFNAMRKENDWADRIIADSPDWVVTDPDKAGRPRVLDMPLRGAERFGTIISAIAKTPGPRQLRLYQAVMDIETALQLHPKDHAGFFIIRPTPGTAGYDEATLNQIDNEIDQLDWRLKLHKNIELDADDSPDQLAKRILVWSNVA